MRGRRAAGVGAGGGEEGQSQRGIHGLWGVRRGMQYKLWPEAPEPAHSTAPCLPPSQAAAPTRLTVYLTAHNHCHHDVAMPRCPYPFHYPSDVLKFSPRCQPPPPPPRSPAQDADAAYQCCCDYTEPTCVIVKHTNPCGIASRGDLREAYRLAVRADPISAFGGIVAFNRTVDADLAREIREFRCVRVCALCSAVARNLFGKSRSVKGRRGGQPHRGRGPGPRDPRVQVRRAAWIECNFCMGASTHSSW